MWLRVHRWEAGYQSVVWVPPNKDGATRAAAACPASDDAVGIGIFLGGFPDYQRSVTNDGAKATSR